LLCGVRLILQAGHMRPKGMMRAAEQVAAPQCLPQTVHAWQVAASTRSPHMQPIAKCRASQQPCPPVTPAAHLEHTQAWTAGRQQLPTTLCQARAACAAMGTATAQVRWAATGHALPCTPAAAAA